MEFTKFPPAKKKEIEALLDADVAKVNAQTQERIKQINQNASNNAYKITQSTPNKFEKNEIENKKADTFFVIGLFIGGALGFADSGILGLIVLAIVGGFIGSLIGTAIGRSNEKSHNDMVDNIAKQNQQKSQAQYDNAKKLVAAENNKNAQKRKELQQQWNNKYHTYKQNFEDAVKQKSVQFAESVLAKRVVELFTDEISRIINSADRSPHIESISEYFSFNVYMHQIVPSSGGIFDFEKNRCQILLSAVDQAALARAIATQINLNLLMKYSTDISGTVPTIKIVNNYTEDSAATVIEYKAANGKYKAAQKW